MSKPKRVCFGARRVGKEGKWDLFCLSLYRENLRSVGERESRTSSIRDLHLENHIKKTKRIETRCTAFNSHSKDLFHISLLCLVNTIPDLIL